MDTVRLSWLGIALFLAGVVGLFVAPVVLPWPRHLAWRDARLAYLRRQRLASIAMVVVALSGLALASWAVIR